MNFISGLIHSSYSNVIVIILHSIISIIIARSLGPEKLGSYTLFLTSINILLLISKTGISDVSLHFYKVGKKNKNLFGVILVSIAIPIVLVCFLATAYYNSHFARDFFNGLNSKTFAIGMILVPLMFFHSIIIRIIQINGDIRFYNYVNIIFRLSWFFAVMICFLVNRITVFNCFLAILTSYLFSLSFAIILRRKFYNFDKIVFKKSFFLKVLKSGFLVQIATLAVFLTEKVSVLFINHYFTLKDIGIYSVASQFFTLLLFIPSTIRQVQIGWIKINQKDNRKINENSMFLLKSCSLLLSMMVIINIIVGPVVIDLIFGVNYMDAYILVPLLSVAAFFKAHGSILGPYFLFYNKNYVLSKSSLYSLFITAISIPLLIKFFGIIGVPIGMCFAFIVSSLYQIIQFKNMAKISGYSKFIINKNDIMRIKGYMSF